MVAVRAVELGDHYSDERPAQDSQAGTDQLIPEASLHHCHVTNGETKGDGHNRAHERGDEHAGDDRWAGIGGKPESCNEAWTIEE
jgi:hypothetical protein